MIKLSFSNGFKFKYYPNHVQMARSRNKLNTAEGFSTPLPFLMPSDSKSKKGKTNGNSSS